jgi:hypothetical protein
MVVSKINAFDLRIAKAIQCQGFEVAIGASQAQRLNNFPKIDALNNSLRYLR